MRVKRILAAALTCCLAVTVTLVGAWAAFSTQVKGQSNAAVAVMAFSMQAQSSGSVKSSLAKANSKVIGSVTVSNAENDVVCQVATRYTITLTADQSVPDIVEPVLIYNGQEYHPTQIDTSRQTFTFASEDFRFGVEAKEERVYDIQFQWDAGPIQPTQTFSFKVSAVSEQID